jgi:hypothetical protein
VQRRRGQEEAQEVTGSQPEFDGDHVDTCSVQVGDAVASRLDFSFLSFLFVSRFLHLVVI